MRFLSSALLLALAGCSLIEDPEPQASVGTFTVVSTLQSNSCGFAALPTPTTYEARAELNGVSGGAASWKWESQGSPVGGSATTSGIYRFTTTRQMVMIPADRFYEYPGCALEERSELVVTVTPAPQATDGGVTQPLDADGGVVARTLKGTYTVDLYPVSGSDCSPLLGANGGNFQTVPCQAKSTLEGHIAN